MVDIKNVKPQTMLIIGFFVLLLVGSVIFVVLKKDKIQPIDKGVMVNMTIQGNYEEIVGSQAKMDQVIAAVKKDIAVRLGIRESQIRILSVAAGSVKIQVFVVGVEPNKAAELSAAKDITIRTANGTNTYNASYLVTQSITTQPPATAFPTTQAPTTPFPRFDPTTQAPTTAFPTTQAPTTPPRFDPTTQPPTTFIDNHADCPVWSARGECNGQSKDWMNANCKKSCNDPATQAPATRAPITQAPTGREEVYLQDLGGFRSIQGLSESIKSRISPNNIATVQQIEQALNSGLKVCDSGLAIENGLGLVVATRAGPASIDRNGSIMSRDAWCSQQPLALKTTIGTIGHVWVFGVKPAINTVGISRFSTEKWSMYDSLVITQPPTTQLPCVDNHADCPAWFASGQCDGQSKAWMNINCKKSCKVCI